MGWAKGKTFTAYEVCCEVCNTTFKTVPTSSKQKTCSRKCSAKRAKKERLQTKCQVCSTPIFSLKSRIRKFCSAKCKNLVLGQIGKKIKELRSSWGEWKNRKVAKTWFIEQYKGCMRCGYDKTKEILELHHIDRNNKNNTKENLLLLCPNCHSEDHWIAKDGQFFSNRGRHAAK